MHAPAHGPANSVETVRFQVEGMHCAGCVASVEAALKRSAGVVAAGVNLATREGFATGPANLVSFSQLQSAVAAAGYALRPLATPETAAKQEDERDRKLAADWRRWWLALGVALPVVVISMAEWHFPGRNWILGVLSLPIVFGTGWPFWKSAISALRFGRADMNTLIALGTGAAFSASVVATVAPQWWPAGQQPHVFYEAAVMIIVFVSLGRLLEERARGRASDAVRRLLAGQSPTARVRRGGNEVEIPVQEVQVGDAVIIKPGERLPVDGVVVEGASWIDESMLTGEPVPVTRTSGDRVFAGTLNQSGGFVLQATEVGEGTVLRQIVRLMQAAQGSKAPIARLADVVSSYFVPAILGVAAVTFVGWLIFGPPESALTHAVLTAVSVLIIACPCALGLATPTAIMVGTGRGAELGVLVKSAAALELAERATVIVFDKTGTLTLGRPVVTGMAVRSENGGANPVSEENLLRYAAAVEVRSEHPLATAIVSAARDRQFEIPTASDFATQAGYGVAATVEGRQVAIGNVRYLTSLGCPVQESQTASVAGETVIHIAVDQRHAGTITVADELKSSARPTVEYLRGQGLRVLLLTGDRRATAEAIANSAGISDVVSEVLPADKIEQIRQLQQSGQVVIMVGDGINDAPALAQADVGIAVGSGTDVAMESSGLILPSSDLTGVATAIALSRQTLRTIRQNLGFAFVYNLLGVPLAAGVFYPFFHHLLDPMLASAAMAMSSVSVVANSLRLRAFQPPLARHPEVPRQVSRISTPPTVTSQKAPELITLDLSGLTSPAARYSPKSD